jgi:hypothetical protein
LATKLPLAEISLSYLYYGFSGPIPMAMMLQDDFDPQAPMREAALFYGLFLRGQSVDSIRRDIDIPKAVVKKVLRTQAYEANLRKAMRRTYVYRQEVLRIFNELVLNEKNRSRLQ